MIEIENIGESISSDMIKGCPVFILRGHHEGDGYGSDILWACTVVFDCDESAATVHALVCAKPNSFNRKKFNAIAKWIKSRGINRVVWARALNGKFVDKEL